MSSLPPPTLSSVARRRASLMHQTSGWRAPPLAPDNLHRYLHEQAYMYGRLRGFEDRAGAARLDCLDVQEAHALPQLRDAPLARAYLDVIAGKTYARVLSHYALLFFLHSKHDDGAVCARVASLLPECRLFSTVPDEDSCAALDAIGQAWGPRSAGLAHFADELDVAAAFTSEMIALLL